MFIKTEKEKIKSSDDCFQVFKKIYDFGPEEDKHKEKMYVMGLNNKNTTLYIDLVGLGTVNQAPVSIRETMRQAIIKNAVGIIVCHNHPSGDESPSLVDRSFTKKLKKACGVLEVALLDHIIISGDNYFSFEKNREL